jgi:hypothetical protein
MLFSSATISGSECLALRSGVYTCKFVGAELLYIVQKEFSLSIAVTRLIKIQFASSDRGNMADMVSIYNVHHSFS